MAPAETIYALSSAPGRAGVAVVRVSGPGAGAALRILTGRNLPPPREAALARLRDGAGQTIDHALVLWFPAPGSFTGEDVAEFHVHGGRAVLEALFAALAAVAGLRPAEPGGFTRRAVENGKFDLTAAEALIDLIDAETQSQRRQALRQQEGALAALYDGWRGRLIGALAWVEASIDFADEELPGGLATEGRVAAGGLAAEMRAHLRDAHRGELVREGLTIAVVGQPNSGKSTLVNALARRDVAIVSALPGTTRDIIEVRLDLGGYAVTLADTAGLREAAEGIEAEGVRRALARAENADLVLLVLDSAAAEPFAGLPAELIASADLVVWNKADLVTHSAPHPSRRCSAAPQDEDILHSPHPEEDAHPSPHPEEPRRGVSKDEGELIISAKTGDGLPELIATLTALVRDRLALASEAPVLTRARHRAAVEEAVAALERAGAAAEPELMAEDMRLAARALGRITGRVDVEDLLDVIFRDFCIGK